MHNIAVVRLLDDALVWYPPGVGEKPRPLDTPEQRETLRETLTQQRWSLCFAAPGEALRLLHLPVSSEEKKHLARSLPFMLEEQVAQDIDELHFAYTALDRQDYGVALCSQDRMQRWDEKLVGLEVNAAHWLPEPLLLPWREGEWCLLLENGRALLRSGECAGFACESSLLGLWLEAALDEGEPQTLVVYGQDRDQDLALLPPALASTAQWRRGSLSAAMILSETVPALNLRQGEYAARLPLTRWWHEWRALAALFIGVFALQLLATWLDLRSAGAEDLALRSAVENSYRQANPRGAMVDPERQLSRQLAELRGGGARSGFMPMLARVGEVLDAESGTLLASLNYGARGGEMRMNIVADDFAAVERVRAGLASAGLSAEMESSSASGEGVRARIRVGGGV